MAHVVPLAPTYDGVDSAAMYTRALEACVAFVQARLSPGAPTEQSDAAMLGALGLPLVMGFADGRAHVVCEGARALAAAHLDGLVEGAWRAATVRGRPAAKPTWCPSLPAGPTGGAWVWHIAGVPQERVLCLWAHSQVALAAAPAVFRVMAVVATVMLLTLRLEEAQGATAAQEATLEGHRVRAETLTLELEQAVRTIDSFTALAAHELRTPLSALMLQTDSAQRLFEQDPVPIDRVERKVQAIAKQVERLRRLVEDLLDVTRLEDGKLVLRREQVDVAEVAGRVAHRLEEAFSRAHTPFAFDISGPAVGTLDGARVEQVLTNLLSNALKYGMGQPVRLEVRPEGDGARVVVTDGGIGIAKDQHQHIFSRYGRAVSERDYGGLGLGLWISRQIVQALGGRIEVESHPGEGATFTAWLPLASAPPAPASAPAEDQ